MRLLTNTVFWCVAVSAVYITTIGAVCGITMLAHPQEDTAVNDAESHGCFEEEDAAGNDAGSHGCFACSEVERMFFELKDSLDNLIEKKPSLEKKPSDMANQSCIPFSLIQAFAAIENLTEITGLRVAVEPPEKDCKFDFENGTTGWNKTGTAFDNQPTYGDNPTARNREPANQQGDWWIGGAENRPSSEDQAGLTQGDAPMGTLTSPPFNITGYLIVFLIGGGCDVKVVRAELVIDGRVVRTATGACSETMEPKFWNVKDHVGKRAQVRLVDQSPRGWGHINFDDLRGDISCARN